MGVKRLVEGEKILLKANMDRIGSSEQEQRVTEYYIDCLCYIPFKSFRLLLALFENNAAKLFEIENFTVIQELTFQSDYGIPKQQTPLQSVSRGK